MSAAGTKRTFRGKRVHVRFRSEADMVYLTACAAFDPKRSKAGSKSHSAAVSCIPKRAVFQETRRGMQPWWCVKCYWRVRAREPELGRCMRWSVNENI